MSAGPAPVGPVLKGYATVPRLFDGGTALILGSGPSLTQADVTMARRYVDAVIAVNDAYAMAPDALVLYAADAQWWQWHEGATRPHTVNRREYPAFTGTYRYTLADAKYPGILRLRKGPETGLTDDPGFVALGRNGVYQAINVAWHLGLTRHLLLGVDMQGTHFFGRHPNNTVPPFQVCLQRFATLPKALAQRGITVINCSRQTALHVFPQQALETALGLSCQQERAS